LITGRVQGKNGLVREQPPKVKKKGGGNGKIGLFF